MLRTIVTVVVSGAAFLTLTYFLRSQLKALIIQELRRSRGQRASGNSRWLVWVSGGVVLALVCIAWIFARPIYGLLCLIFLPRALKRVTAFVSMRRSVAIDHSGISFLYALQGLLKVGVNLPTAFFQLSSSTPSAFGDSLQIFLRRFSKGVSLTECLEQFRQSAPLETVGNCLALLEMAYRNGFAVGQLLDRMLPSLEAELQNQLRIRVLRRASLVQAAFACSIPWLLGVVLYLFQPEIMQHFMGSTVFIPLLGFSILMEGTGLYCIWKWSEFY